jgi:hypothetical protein
MHQVPLELWRLGSASHMAASDTTWVAVQEFKAAYLDVQLTDELFLGEKGNVIDSFVGQVYHIRKAQPNKE